MDCIRFHVLGVPRARNSTTSISYWSYESIHTGRVTFTRLSTTKVYNRKMPKNLRYPRRAPLPPEPEADRFFRKRLEDVHTGLAPFKDGGLVWEADEIEAISSLFRGRIPQKPGKLVRERPLPLPTPHVLRPLGLPTPKRNTKPPPSPATLSKQLYKNPEFLTSIARDIKSLPAEKNVSLVLNKSVPFLRKGSLSLTVRELGHMGLPDRALQTFCWAQKQPALFPDDRTLASTVEVLARFHELKVPFNLEKFKDLASQPVMEAMVRGFIKGGSLKLAWKLIFVAKNNNRMLGCSVYAKLILGLAKNPDKHPLILTLLDELAEREDLNFTPEDCTSVMKVCKLLKRYDLVESLYNWYKQTGRETSIVMYTTVIHSRINEQKYREGMALVWEMEEANCLLDFPAYRVVIKLLVSLNDIPRTNRYFKRLKDCGFTPTYDIYRDLMKLFLSSGRLAKCREIKRELEAAGLQLESQLSSQLIQLETQTKLVLS